MRLRQQQLGFTMVELLLTIALVGVLAVVALPQFIDYRQDAKMALLTQRAQEIRESIVGNPTVRSNGMFLKPGYKNEMGDYPATLDDLITQGAQAPYDQFKNKGWHGPYLTATPDWKQDPWGTDWVYSQTDQTLTSCGPDRACGNADDIIFQIESADLAVRGSSSSVSSVAVIDPCSVVDTACFSGGGMTYMRSPRTYMYCGVTCYEIYDCVGGPAAGAVHSVGASPGMCP